MTPAAVDIGAPIEVHELAGALGGKPTASVIGKVRERIDDDIRAFLEDAPYAVLATIDRHGQMDVSPRGGDPGFIGVLDERRIGFFDALGNRRADSIRNILETGRGAVMAMVPGVPEVLRLNGAAAIHRIAPEPASPRGRTTLMTVISIEDAYLHCGKAATLGNLWHPRHWGHRDRRYLKALMRPGSDYAVET